MRFFIIFLIITNIFSIDATMEIIKNSEKLPYIIVEVNGKNNDLNSKLYKMLIADLKVSSHFNVVEVSGDDFINDKDIDYNFYSAKNINLIARINSDSVSNSVVTTLMLYDVNMKNIALSKKYTIGQDSKYPFISHKIAVDINDYIKAPSIEWMNRSVVLSKYTKSEESVILVADYTLTFQNPIIKGGLNIFPKWGDKDQRTIYFTKYYDKPTLVKYNIYTGEMQKILSSDGMIVASDISKDESKLLLTMSPNGQPDIYLLNLKTSALDKLTNYNGIDVGANFIDNEDSIMFVSDRLGYPNIFSLNLATRIVNQLAYNGRNNSSASAYSSYVVYSSRESDNEFGNNIFNLYLISTKSNYIRRLTANGINQMPRFSTDGDSIMFIKSTDNESSLGILRLNYNNSYLFPLTNEKIQAMDW